MWKAFWNKMAAIHHQVGATLLVIEVNFFFVFFVFLVFFALLRIVVLTAVIALIFHRMLVTESPQVPNSTLSLCECHRDSEAHLSHHLKVCSTGGLRGLLCMRQYYCACVGPTAWFSFSTVPVAVLQDDANLPL